MKNIKYLIITAITFGAMSASAFVYGPSMISVELMANGAPTQATMPFGSAPTLSWEAPGASNCTGSQSGAPSVDLWTGSLGASGSKQMTNLTKDTLFNIICEDGAGTTVTDSVMVYLKSFVRPSVASVTSKEPGGFFFPGTTAYVVGQGFLPTDNVVNVSTMIGYGASTTASSVDSLTMSFIIPDDVPIGSYNFWVNNWNGISNFKPITISAPGTTAPPTTPTTPISPSPTTPTSPTESTCVTLPISLKYTSRDSSTNGGVSILQTFLAGKGYLNSEATGYFGGMTLAAVKQFQGANGIEQTGYVGPLTRGKIQELTCK